MYGELESFVQSWTDDANKVKELFIAIRTCLETLPFVRLEYKGRPGISHSLRAYRSDNMERPLFVLVDVIDDDPAQRWLSVCFFADLIADAEGRGDIVPGGLMGEDARCFDADSFDAGAFLLAKLQEAYTRAAT